MAKQLQQKSYRFKADVQDAEQGIVHCVVSVFDVVDSDGDVLRRGAFARSIAEGKQKGALPPGVWSHDWDRPIAKTLDAWEAEDGLHVLGQCNLETADGRDAFSNIKQGLFPQYSFGFLTRQAERSNGARIITDVDWLEWSPVLVGANRETYTVDVKTGKKVERKGAVLGDVEPAMTLAALDRLQSRLYYFWANVLRDPEEYWYGCVPEPTGFAELTDAQVLELCGQALAEFQDLALRFIETGLTLASEDRKSLTTALRARAGLQGAPTIEAKSGRRHSAADLAVMEAALDHADTCSAHLRELMGPDEDDGAEAKAAADLAERHGAALRLLADLEVSTARGLGALNQQ